MTSASGMPCPVCRVPLVMSERQNVEIDYCPQCRGVWLDRGELDKIIQRSASEQGGMDQQPAARQPIRSPQVDAGYQAGYGRPHKRRKSFFEELFD